MHSVRAVATVASMDDDILEELEIQLAPLSDEVGAELLLTCFARAIETLDIATLDALRVQCESLSEGTNVDNAMLDVLDGQIALRGLGTEARSESE